MAQVAGRSAYQRGYGPHFAAAPPACCAKAVDGGIWLTRDRRTLFASFTGGPAFDLANPCTEDDTGWAGVDGDTLTIEVATLPHPDQATMGPGTGRTLVGYTYIVEFRLPAPFEGTTVVDRGRGPIWLPPPDRVADVGLPDGWWLKQVQNEPSIHRIGRVFGPDPAAPGARDQFIVLAQTFAGPPDAEIVPAGTIEIHGADVPIGRNGPDGWIVSWQLGGDGLTLSTWDPTITPERVAAMANSVAAR